MTDFKGYFESTMRLSLFLYTNKEKLQPFPLIALFLTPNVVCEKHHDVILDKTCLSFSSDHENNIFISFIQHV